MAKRYGRPRYQRKGSLSPRTARTSSSGRPTELEAVWRYSPPPIESYRGDFLPSKLSRLRALLSGAFDDVLDRDARAVRAGASVAERHPLAVLIEHARLAAEAIATGRPAGFIPDLTALIGVVNSLEQFQIDPTFPEIVGHCRSPEGYRHDMLVLGMAGLLQRLGVYEVRLLSSAHPGGALDFEFGPPGQRRLAVEVKAPDLFDGPTRSVTRAEAERAIENVWRDALGGSDPQIPDSTPALLLTGGVTLRLESLPVIHAVAEDWIREHGPKHPNVSGIGIMTYYATTQVGPPGPGPGGLEIPVVAVVSTTLVYALNPAPNVMIRLRLGPPLPRLLPR